MFDFMMQKNRKNYTYPSSSPWKRYLLPPINITTIIIKIPFNLYIQAMHPIQQCRQENKKYILHHVRTAASKLEKKHICQNYALIQIFNSKRNFSYMIMSSLQCYHKCNKKDIIDIFTIMNINIEVVYITCSSFNFKVTQTEIISII